MVKPKSGVKPTALFDIRLKNLDHDVLVLKGSELNAASTFLSGKIVLLVNEPISVKKMTLRLYATIRLKYNEPPMRGAAPKQTRFERKIYEYVWEPSEITKYLNNMYENTGKGVLGISGNISGATSPGTQTPTKSPLSMSKAGSVTSLKNLGMSFRSKSSTSLSHLHSLAGSATSMGGHPNSASSSNLAKNGHMLVLGNYEFPFSAILPGDMPESVEGLPGGSVIYKLESTIDRGKFHNVMTAKKHVRVVRTMTTDSVELSETVAVDNTWPKKIEYSLSVPSKAIAIGSGTPISMMLVPLLKGLQLGEIRVTLVELYSYVGYLPPPHTSERIVCEKVIPAPREDDPNFQMDKWELTTMLRVPTSLSQCTQDCDILSHLKVRHKLKFVIGLRNPDGHTSELRASLPVQLFISPFVTIKARAEDDASEAGSIDGHEDEDEEILFSSGENSGSVTNLDQLDGSASGTRDGLRSNQSHTSFTGLVAPPIYEQHIYDKLWSDVSPMESPITSGTTTPRSMYTRPDVLQFSMSSIDTAQLAENLRQLSIQRQMQENSENTVSSAASALRDRAVFNLDGDSEGDYLTKGRPVGHSNLLFSSVLSSSLPSGGYAGALSPGIMSPPLHLSRAGSDTSVNNANLFKVPSYGEAMKSSVEETLSPAYKPPLPGSSINLEQVNKRFEESCPKSPPSGLASSRNRLFLSRGSSSFNLKTMSKNSSGNSSPSNSANVSAVNLASMLGDGVSRTPSKKNTRTTGSATFSMTPI